MRKLLSKIYHAVGKKILKCLSGLEYKFLHLYPHNMIHLVNWIVVDKYRFSKILRKNVAVKNIRPFKISNWHLTYRYYTAELNGEKVFIKRGYKYDSLARENYIYEKVNSEGLNKYIQFLPGCITYHPGQGQDCYMITKFMEADSLKQTINSKDLNTNDSNQIIQQLFEIFKMFVELNVIHTDINPNNFFVKRECGNSVKVIVFDFGFSIIRDSPNFRDLKGNDVYHDLRTLGGSFKLEPFYYDDAYSMLQVMKVVEPSLKSIFPDIWKYISERQGQMYYRLKEKNNEDK